MASEATIKLLIIYLTKPQTAFYLSKIILKADSPRLEPYQAAGLDLGELEVAGLRVGVKLANINIQGMSNIQIKKEGVNPAISLNGSEVTFYADRPNTEAPPAGIPQLMIFDADLLLFKASGEPLDKGQLHVEIKNAELAGVFNATSADGKAATVNIEFTKLVLQKALDQPGNITAVLNIKSFIKQALNKIINKQSTLQKLVDGLNDKLQDPGILQAISKGATDAAREALRLFPAGL